MPAPPTEPPSRDRSSRSYISPHAARVALRFQREEMPLFLLALLEEHGDLVRADLTQACFGKAPTRPQKMRVYAQIDTLLKKKLIRALGRVRHYTFRPTAAGLRKLALLRETVAAPRPV